MHSTLSQARMLDELFPFHIVVATDPDLSVVAHGRSLERLVGRSLVGESFSTHFTIRRSGGASLIEAAQQGSLVQLGAANFDWSLRGQLWTDRDCVIFAGSPAITQASALADLGLEATDFAPHDMTLDVVTLHHWRTMQVADLERRAAELDKAFASRDLFSERASTDSLTGLANRRAFREQWSTLSTSAAESSADRVLALVDVDAFKQINDTHGHGAGDLALSTVAARLDHSVRSGDVVARLGGDEFAILLTPADRDTGQHLLQRIHTNLLRPIDLGGARVTLYVSMGVTSVRPGVDVDTALDEADLAMYAGRADGGCQVKWFHSELRADRDASRQLAVDLQTAIERRTISPAFQPIVNLGSTGAVGAEALARWHHPELGPVRPDVFIAAGERAGCISELDQLILGRALGEAAAWRRGGSRIGVSVNLSAGSVVPSLVAKVHDALKITGIDPAAVTLEVTETSILDREQEAVEVLDGLKQLGVRLSLDDFGTGFSSLTHLRSLPVDEIKIDRSFVSELTSNARDKEIVSSVVGLAKSLGIETVAEGVETADQAEQLKAMGVDLGQGYHFARPGTAADITSAGHPRARGNRSTADAG